MFLAPRFRAWRGCAAQDAWVGTGRCSLPCRTYPGLAAHLRHPAPPLSPPIISSIDRIAFRYEVLLSMGGRDAGRGRGHRVVQRRQPESAVRGIDGGVEGGQVGRPLLRESAQGRVGGASLGEPGLSRDI